MCDQNKASVCSKQLVYEWNYYIIIRSCTFCIRIIPWLAADSMAEHPFSCIDSVVWLQAYMHHHSVQILIAGILRFVSYFLPWLSFGSDKFTFLSTRSSPVILCALSFHQQPMGGEGKQEQAPHLSQASQPSMLVMTGI